MILLNSRQAARELQISVTHLHRLCRQRKIRFALINGRDRAFRPQWLLEYVDSQTVPPLVLSEDRVDNTKLAPAYVLETEAQSAFADDWKAIRQRIRDELETTQILNSTQKI